MSKVTLSDISLKDITLETLPRLKRLRDVHFAAKAEICIELPRNITRYMKERDAAGDSAELRAGKLYRYVLENKKPVIADENLLAGTTSTKALGVMLYPDFLALTIWPELETVSSRKKNPYRITRREIDELNFQIFPYWLDRTVQEVARRDNNNPLCQRIMERIVFYLTTKTYCISHTIPNYAAVVEKGLNRIIAEAQSKERDLGETETESAQKDFYRAVQLSLGGIIKYAEHLSTEAKRLAKIEPDPIRRQDLLTMGEICRRIPAEKPRTLREALNAIWICKVALHQENTNVALSLGRLDQVLYPFYVEDVSKGMTPAQAAELIGCFWLKIADHLPLSPETGEELFGGSGSNQAVTLGGVDMEGKDAVNDLTYVMLRVTELLRIRDPNVNARYYPGVNSPEYLRRLCDVNINTGATPCFHNDMPVIETLTSQGITLEHARDYSSVGCVEPSSGGRTFGHTGCLLMNLTSALEMALFGGKHRLTEDDQIGPKTKPLTEMASFEEFKEAFQDQLSRLIDQAVTLNNNMGRAHQKIHPTPMLSALMEGCMEKGKDVIFGGALYNSSGVAIIGLAEVVDSITALDEFVFSKKKISAADLIAAINSDWAGPYRKLQIMIKASNEKFGRDSNMAKANADWLISFLHDRFQSLENYRGGKYTVGYWTMTNHAGFGALTGALPSGRPKGEPFASGITPVSGSAPILTACLNFIAHLDHTKIADGHALNLKYVPSTTTIENFAHTVEAFFRTGGMQVQFNIIDRQTLEDARVHPEKYPDLLVRVSGYTAYFKDLNPHMQQEIITRAEYDLGGS